MTNGSQPPGAAPAKKKGLPTIAWIAIGCGGILIVCLIAFAALGFFAVQKGKEMVQEATGSESFEEFVEGLQDDPARTAAETMIRVNPDLDLVSTDEDAGTITFRNNKTGETATLDFDEIAAGRFSVTTEEGEFSVDASGEGVTFTGPEGQTRLGADLGDVPAWVPLYPGGGDWTAGMVMSGAQGASGAVSGQTSDSAEKVSAYYLEWLEDQGYEVESQSLTRTGDGIYGSVSGESASDGRSVSVAMTGAEGALQLVVSYREPSR